MKDIKLHNNAGHPLGYWSPEIALRERVELEDLYDWSVAQKPISLVPELPEKPTPLSLFVFFKGILP